MKFLMSCYELLCMGLDRNSQNFSESSRCWFVLLYVFFSKIGTNAINHLTMLRTTTCENNQEPEA